MLKELMVGSYFSENTSILLSSHTDRSSDTIILFRTDLNLLLCLLEIGQSVFPNFTPTLYNDYNYKFGLNFFEFLNDDYSVFKPEILKC